MHECVIINFLDEEICYTMCIAWTYRDRDDFHSHLMKLLVITSRKVILSLIELLIRGFVYKIMRP